MFSRTGVSVNERLHYSVVIEWSDEDQVYIASLPEWGPLVHAHGASYDEALQRGKELIEGLVTARQYSGESLPLSPWLYRITVNLSYTYVTRRNKWRVPLEDFVDQLIGRVLQDQLRLILDAEQIG